MAQYVTLGARKARGVADSSGNNKGNWTATFDDALLSVKCPYYECYKIIVHGAPASTFDVFINENEWDTSVAGDVNSWDPNEPMPLRPGEALYFYYSDPTTDGNPPSVTIWLRYDASIPANQSAGFYGAE